MQLHTTWRVLLIKLLTKCHQATSDRFMDKTAGSGCFPERYNTLVGNNTAKKLCVDVWATTVPSLPTWITFSWRLMFRFHASHCNFVSILFSVTSSIYPLQLLSAQSFSNMCLNTFFIYSLWQKWRNTVGSKRFKMCNVSRNETHLGPSQKTRNISKLSSNSLSRCTMTSHPPQEI